MKRLIALMMAALMLLVTTPVESLAADAVPKENYIINTSQYMTRLRTNYDSEAEFELGFKVRLDNEEVDRFTAAMGDGLLAGGSIRINEGENHTFADAGMEFATAKSKSSFLTHNKEFIKEFYNLDTFNVTITTPEGYEITAENITNQMLPEERDAFKESLGGNQPEQDTAKYHIDPNYTFIKNQYGAMVLRIDIKEFTSGSDPAKKAFLDNATISINNVDFGSMKDLGFTITNYFGFELADLSKISSVILSDTLNFVLTEGSDTLSFSIENQLSVEDRQSIAGTTPEPEPEVKAQTISNIQAMLVKSDDPTSESMSGATMKHEAELIDAQDGSYVAILHFAPAEIMGILAYATDLQIEDAISKDFVLKEDNSAVAVVKLPGFTDNEKVFQGHIYSSVMDADVALKIVKSEDSKDLATALSEKVTEVEKMLQDHQYYENTKKPVDAALKEAKAPKDLVEAYAGLVKAVAGLRKIAENPFDGDTIFHVEVKDTSIIGSKSLNKYAKIEKKNDKNIMTVHYDRYLEWSGEVYMEKVQVFDKEGTEIPSEYKLDKYKTGTLTFEMPYIPASGIFDVKLTVGNGQGTQDAKIQMDLSTIKKGPFRELLTEAIDEYGFFTGADWQTREPMENRKDDFTEASWNAFAEALQKAKGDLTSPTLTQDQIEADIQALKDARFNLVYNIQAGKGNTANAGIGGLNKPEESYYKDQEAEYPEYVGWGGSKVVFGNDGEVFRVLDITDGGRILLMSENLRVKKPFTNSQLDQDVRWSTSLMREYMNLDFYNQAFSNVEKNAIVQTRNETIDYEDGYLGPPAAVPNTTVVTEDYIFAPDMKMMSNEAYGYGSKDSRIVATEYALRNVFIDAWSDELAILGVSPKGRIAGTFVASSQNMEAPVCMNIDSSNILMTVDAKTGIKEGLTEAKKLDSNLWKFVMQDDSMKLAASYDAKVDGHKISTDLGIYNGKVMAVIVEGNDFKTGTIKSYGIVDPEGFEVPQFDTSKEKIYVMAIKDEDGKTAYASAPALLNVKENVQPEGPDPEVDPQPDTQSYTASIQMNQNGKLSPSMCDPMFAAKADLEAVGDDILMKLYVANPVPNFPDLGADGTVKNFKITFNGKDYLAESDMESKPLMEVKADNTLFGLKKGDKIAAQVLKVVLPREAFNECKLDVKCYVNVVMNSDAEFDMVLSDVSLPKKPDTEVDPDPQKPTPDTKPEPQNPTPDTKPEPEKPAPDTDQKLDYKNLKDGVYMIDASMVKTDRSTPSMCDNAFNHKVKLTVKDGKYLLTLSFNGMQIGDKLGYLGNLKYFLSGYNVDQYGAPTGNTANATVESFQMDENGNRLKDQYGTDYPSVVTFEMIPEALEDGFVPLEVFVPVMASISEATGTQQVYLKLAWNTIKGADENDPAFANKGTQIGSSSSLGSGLGSGISMNKPGMTPSVKTGDVVQNHILWTTMLLLGVVLAFVGVMEFRRRKEN